MSYPQFTQPNPWGAPDQPQPQPQRFQPPAPGAAAAGPAPGYGAAPAGFGQPQPHQAYPQQQQQQGPWQQPQQPQQQPQGPWQPQQQQQQPHSPSQYGSYGAAPYGAPSSGPSVFAPPPPPQAQGGGQAGGQAGFAGMDPFLTGVAGNMLRQQGQSYLARGQAFMQSRLGFLSGSSLHYHFSITPEYVRSKLFMLAAPYLKRWNYVRHAEQISGGHKYLPPRQDINAPDLYIPVMALWTYCLLLGVAALARAGPGGGFKPEVIYNSVSSACTAWLGLTLLLKVILYLLGIPSAVPLLELAAYAGYTFTAACACVLVQLVTDSSAAYHVVWAYTSLCLAVFLVRTMKRVIFQEARTYSIDSTRHNYLLLGLALLMWPTTAWLAKLPALPKAAAAAAAAAKGAAAARGAAKAAAKGAARTAAKGAAAAKAAQAQLGDDHDLGLMHTELDHH